MQSESDRERQSILQQHLRSARVEDMMGMLRCRLCGGLLRFAHTLTECGHSFCQLCIFSYLNAFKGRNPEVKCPDCHASVDSAFHRSVLRDAFKQGLVDLLDPAYAARQKTLIERISCLFPEFSLAFLLEDFSLASDSLRRRRAEKSRVMTGLAAAVRNKLGLSFQAFSEQVAEDDGFQRLLVTLAPARKEEKAPLTLDLRPRGQHDLRFVGVNCRLKGNRYLVHTLRRFLEKRVLQRLQTHEDLARELIEPECSDLQIRVELFFEDRILEDREDLSLVAGIDQEPVYYRLIR